MIKKIFTYILSVAAITFMVQTSVMAISQDQQWKYVSEVIQVQQHELTTASSKLGYCLSEGAVFLSMPLGALAALQGAVTSRINHTFSNNNQTNFFVGGILGGTVGSLVAYGIFKAIGTLLEARPALCKKILIAYVAEWKVHKRNTPESIRSIFKKLRVEFKKDANISSVSEEQACQIIESLLAISMLCVEAAK